jgi:V/A-type H+-transporting ATPase subunit I
MLRVDVLAPRRRALDLVRALHLAGVLDLAPFEPPDEATAALFGPGPELPAAQEYGAAVARLTELAVLVGRGDAPRDLVGDLWALDDGELLGVVERLLATEESVAGLTGRRARLSGELARLEQYRSIVDALTGAVGRLPAVRGFAATGLVLQARYRSILPVLRAELEDLTDGACELIAGELPPDRIGAIVVYPARRAPEVESLLGARDLEEVRLPEAFTGLALDELGPRLAAEMAATRQRLAEVEAELEAQSARIRPLVEACLVVLRDRIAEVGAVRSGAASDHLVVVSGWLPADELADLRSHLTREIGPEVVVVERERATPGRAEVPVALDNRGPVRAFEALSTFVAIPRYGSLDPTPILGIGFPAFVGLMVGDAGYGLVALIALVLARRRWHGRPWMAVLWPVGLVVVGSTIGFGLLFGEVFGSLGHALLGIRPILLDRRDALGPLLVLAVAIGATQVGLGLVLGVVNAALLRHRQEATARGALLVAVAAVGLLLAVAAGLLGRQLLPVAGGALVLAAAVLLVTVGIRGPMEILGTLGHVLSYARLAAIGLASVMLAVVADRLGSLVPNALAGILVAAVLHALNIGLGFFDASIQSLRLHYVEFFTKFLEPGGRPYRPFRAAVGPEVVHHGDPSALSRRIEQWTTPSASSLPLSPSA